MPLWLHRHQARELQKRWQRRSRSPRARDNGLPDGPLIASTVRNCDARPSEEASDRDARSYTAGQHGRRNTLPAQRQSQTPLEAVRGQADGGSNDGPSRASEAVRIPSLVVSAAAGRHLDRGGLRWWRNSGDQRQRSLELPARGPAGGGQAYSRPGDERRGLGPAPDPEARYGAATTASGSGERAAIAGINDKGASSYLRVGLQVEARRIAGPMTASRSGEASAPHSIPRRATARPPQLAALESAQLSRRSTRRHQAYHVGGRRWVPGYVPARRRRSREGRLRPHPSRRRLLGSASLSQWRCAGRRRDCQRASTRSSRPRGYESSYGVRELPSKASDGQPGRRPHHSGVASRETPRPAMESRCALSAMEPRRLPTREGR